eukprot:1187098-Prorocentrum_minimum.AAC.8
MHLRTYQITPVGSDDQIVDAASAPALELRPSDVPHDAADRKRQSPRQLVELVSGPSSRRTKVEGARGEGGRGGEGGEGG